MPIAIVNLGRPDALVVVAVVVVGLLLGATLARRDLWPFSHYPMFAAQIDAATVRFFLLQVRRADGSVATLAGAADALVDPFHRACERLWTGAEPTAAARDALAFRTWRDACEIEPRFAEAEKLEIVMRVARVGAGDKVFVAETVVHGTAPVARERA